METVSAVHQAAFAFIGNGPPRSINWNEALRQAMRGVGLSWDGRIGPDTMGLRENCYPPITEREMYDCAEQAYGISPLAAIKGKGWSCVTINFSQNSILGAGKLLVVYEGNLPPSMRS